MSVIEAKSVVLLASSRPRGNTYALAGAAFQGEAVRFVNLSELQIGYYSYENANEKDDFLRLVQELVVAPLWVLATPMYWYTVSAQAKTFLDRITDLLENHKALGRKLRGKSFAVVVAGTDPQPPASFDEPLKLTCRFLGMRYLGMHYAQFSEESFVSSSAAEDAAMFGRRVLEAAG